MRAKYFSIADACKHFPSIKSTVNKAKKAGITILRHKAEYTKRGAVSAHWLLASDTNQFERNQRLNCRLNQLLDAIKRQQKNLKEYIQQP